MKSAVLYASKVRGAGSYIVGGRLKRVGDITYECPKCFVRMEVFDDIDCLRALNEARPREGEIVLNSIEL